MYKLLSEQLKSTPPVSPTDDENKRQLDSLQGEMATLSASLQSMKRERDQALSDVTALRDTMMHNRQETARKVRERGREREGREREGREREGREREREGGKRGGEREGGREREGERD